MPHCTVIYNPVASRFDNALLVAILERLKDSGYVCSVVKSNRAGAVIPLVRERNDKCDLILTMGGDGTVSEAIQGFSNLEQHATYAHISMGTTNDVGSNLGLNPKDPLGSLELILNGQERYVDYLTVNGNPVFYVSCFGFITDVPHKTPSVLKRKLGRAGYVTYFAGTALKHLPRRNAIKVVADGNCFETEGVTVLVTNSERVGGIKLLQNIDLGDGLFELTIIEKLTPNLARKLFNDYLHDNLDIAAYPECLRSLKVKELTLEFDNAGWNTDLDNDGEEFRLPRKENIKLEYKIAGQIKMLLP